jgi:hypothetical protein
LGRNNFPLSVHAPVMMVNLRRNTPQFFFGNMFWLDVDVGVVGDKLHFLAYFIVVFKDLNIL